MHHHFAPRVRAPAPRPTLALRLRARRAADAPPSRAPVAALRAHRRAPRRARSEGDLLHRPPAARAPLHLPSAARASRRSRSATRLRAPLNPPYSRAATAPPRDTFALRTETPAPAAS